MPHYRHMVRFLLASTCIVCWTFVIVVKIVILSKVEEEIDEGVDNLGRKGVLLGEQSLQEEAIANLVLHMGKLHDASGGIEVIEAALGKDASNDDRLARCGVLSQGQQEAPEECTDLENSFLDGVIEVNVELLVLLDI